MFKYLHQSVVAVAINEITGQFIANTLDNFYEKIESRRSPAEQAANRRFDG